MKDFIKLSCTDGNKTMILNLNIYEIMAIFVTGKDCSMRVRKEGILGYNYFTIENISYSGDIKEMWSMKTDNEKLLDLDKVIDEAISKIEDIGEFKDYDIDQKVERIYNKLEDLSIDVFEMLFSKGLAEEDRDLW